MKKYYLLLLALFFAGLPVQAQTEYGLKFSSLISDNLTLENAIRLGLENNSEFLTAQQEITIAEQRVSEAKFRYLPQFALQGTATYFDLDYPMVLPDAVANRVLSDNYTKSDKDRLFGVGLTATQYIYSGGRISSTLKMARANLKQLQSRYEIVKNAVVLDVKKSFYNLLFAQHYDELCQKNLERAEKWYKNPTGDIWAQLRIQALLEQLREQRSQAARQLVSARMAMLVSLNKETNASFSITGDFAPVRTDVDLSHLNLWAIEFRPELKSALYALEADNIAMDLVLSKRYPDIILNGSYEYLGTDNLQDTNKQISLAVRLPIPYNFSEQIIQKKAEQKKSSLRRAAIEDKIRRQVASGLEDMRFWQDEVLARQNAYEKLDALLTKAPRPAASNASALEGLLAYQQAAYAYLDAIRHNLTAKAELEWAIGQDL